MKTVLLVEDDPINAQVLTHLLRAHGYRPVVAYNGADGVETFHRERPALAIVDIQLPRKNGFEVCFDMKRTEHGKSMPVLLMSAVYTDTDHARRYSAELHADGYLLKPFDMSALVKRVRDLIGQA